MTDLSMPSSSVRLGAAVPVPAPDVDENATGDVAVAKTPTKKRPLHKQLTFTLFMTGGMVTLMSLYNTALHTWFNFTLFDWLSGLLLRWPIAFVTSLTIGDVIAKRALMPLVRKIASPSGWIASHIIPFCKVNAMVPFMTFFASLLSVGISQDLLPLWAFTYVTTLPAALAVNVTLVGPLARKMYRLAFGEKF